MTHDVPAYLLSVITMKIATTRRSAIDSIVYANRHVPNNHVPQTPFALRATTASFVRAPPVAAATRTAVAAAHRTTTPSAPQTQIARLRLPVRTVAA